LQTLLAKENMKRLLIAFFAVACSIIWASPAYAATINIEMIGLPRAAAPEEITALSTYLVDGDSTIPARGNVEDLYGPGWLANPDRDLLEGTHEVVIMEWNSVNIPSCASSVRLNIDTTLQRLGMDIEDTDDSLEWIHALVLGAPSSPGSADIINMAEDGRFKTISANGTNPYGQDVPADISADYTISNGISSIDTTALTPTDLKGSFFSFIYFDTQSTLTENVSWMAKINSATVTYDDSNCTQIEAEDNKPPQATLANTGNDQANIVTIAVSVMFFGSTATLYRAAKRTN